MHHEVVTLPSSAQIRFRRVMLNDENVLASALKDKRSDIDDVLTKIVTSCAEEVIDPGPYPFLEIGSKPDWANMAKGDRFAAMLDLRCLSYKEGNILEADLHCPDIACKCSFSWDVDLKKDLIRQDLPEESIEKIKAGEPFEVVIDGRKVLYTIALGKTEKLAEKYTEQYRGRDMAAGLRSRIISVEGVESRDIMDWLDGQGKSDYPGLTSDDAEELRDAFDRVDCGIDTTTEAECPKCREWFDFTLPSTGMFLPGKGISKRKKEARKQKMAKQPSAE